MPSREESKCLSREAMPKSEEWERHNKRINNESRDQNDQSYGENLISNQLEVRNSAL